MNVFSSKSPVRMVGSVFNTFFADRMQATISLPEWINVIASGKFASQGAAYTKFLNEGKKKLAQGIKQSLPNILCAGVASNGRKKNDVLAEMSDIRLVDYDCYTPGWTESLSERLRDLPWVAAFQRSLSGGAHVFVVMPDVPQEHNNAYLMVLAEALDKLAGFVHDTACDHLMRLSLASHDPNAWCRPAEECEPYPFSKVELARVKRLIDGEKRHENKVETVDLSKVVASDVRMVSDEAVENLIAECQKEFPYVEHQHHDSLLFMGAKANYERFSTADVAYLAQLIESEYKVDGYNYAEVLRNLMAGYAYPATMHKLRRDRMRSCRIADGFADEYDYNQQLQLIESTCPYFGEEVFKNMPDIILGLLQGLSKRQRDALLASIFAAASGMMANVKCHYRHKVLSPHLALCVVGPAGSGKGICLDARRLVEPIQEEYDEMYQKQMRDYRVKMRQYKIQLDKNAEGALDEPQMPQRVAFVNGDVTSLSRFIDDQANTPHGMIMFSSEIAEINRMEHSEYGRLSSLMCKVFMNEPISKNFKEGGMVSVPFPMAAAVLTGTSNAFCELMGSVETGLLSRSCILSCVDVCGWTDLVPELDNEEVETERDRRFEEAGRYCKDMFHYLQQHPTDVRFSIDSYPEINSFFEYCDRMVCSTKHEELKSLVYRGPILCLRIASVLTGFRKFETKSTERSISVHPDDFRIAMAMTRVFMAHGAQHSTMISPKKGDKPTMKKLLDSDTVFAALADDFRTKDAVDRLQAMGMGRTVAYEVVKSWEAEGKITITGKSNCHKVERKKQG